MFNKVVFGVSILLASNLIVSSLAINSQAFIFGMSTRMVNLTVLAIIVGAFLGYSLRGIGSDDSSANDNDEW